jgi:hypothetical protein
VKTQRLEETGLSGAFCLIYGWRQFSFQGRYGKTGPGRWKMANKQQEKQEPKQIIRCQSPLRSQSPPALLDEGTVYVATNYPWESAAFFWTKITNLNTRANNGASVTDITKIVNGGYNALKEREEAYAKCLQVIY